MMRLGFLGCGTIAAAVVRALAGQGHQITVSERSLQVSYALAAEFVDVTVADNQTVLDQSDIVFLGLIGASAPEVLSPLRLDGRHRVISFMADLTLDQVADLVAPAQAEAIMLPFPAIARGGSPILAMGEGDLLSDLFEPRDQVFLLEGQAELDSYLAAQAVLSPVALMVAEASAWLGQHVADEKRGEAFLRRLVTGSLSNMTGADLVQSLNTPGGYNQRLRQHLEASGMVASLQQGLTALKDG